MTDAPVLTSPAELTVEQLAKVVLNSKAIKKWLTDIEEHVLTQAYDHGVEFPGLKVVRGAARRTIKDPEGFLRALEENGVGTDGLSQKVVKLETITVLERKLGSKLEDTPASEFITKTTGKLTLAPASDKRPAEIKAEATASAYENLEI
ncbi:MAG: DUF2800 domain-containing protein [Rothia mucilaginosa]|uniref:DUF2800 domain-containing protein n=1 Tax=Rothia mucilaginosa TaxID=43675 RepID=A0A930LSE2_9MICC|nr:DUF2800 domain-containing protein [Rothia mucilaginosa]